MVPDTDVTQEKSPKDEVPGLDQAAEEGDMPAVSPESRHVPNWIRIGLGIVALILIAVLAGPTLVEQFQKDEQPSDTSSADLEQSLAADPDNEQLRYNLAAAYYQEGRFEAAWEQLRSVPAYVAIIDNQPEIVNAEQAVQSSPDSKEAHFKLGTAWARADLLTPAESAFKRAIALDEKYADARVNLGVVYYRLGQLDNALAEYNAALAINPNDADVYHNMGAVYVQQALLSTPPDEGLLDKGLEAFQRALEINPELYQAYFSLGVIHDLRGQKDEAISYFQKFLEMDDGSDTQATTSAHTYLQQLQQQ